MSKRLYTKRVNKPLRKLDAENASEHTSALPIAHYLRAMKQSRNALRGALTTHTSKRLLG